MFEIPAATRPPQTTSSSDGTTIAYDVHGSGGPLVILVGGATTTRMMATGLSEALAAVDCTAVTYDRRGRGDSTDTAPYAVQREVEDLAAVIEAVRPGEQAVVAGFSSGAALVLQAAAAAGAPIARAVPFEPPYRLAASPPLPDDYTGTLERFTAAGDNDRALEFFLVRAVGLPQATVDEMKGTDFWDLLAATAPTLAYDGYCLGGDDQRFPEAMVEGIAVPMLALASSASPPFLQDPAQRVAQVAPHATFELLDGEFHTVPDHILAPRVAAFARS